MLPLRPTAYDLLADDAGLDGLARELPEELQCHLNFLHFPQALVVIE